MSWTDRELKRRAAQSKGSAVDQPAATSPSARMQELWSRIERSNDALPADLRLHMDRAGTGSPESGGPTFVAWLRAPNGAALGFAGDGIRYVWPATDRKKSNNFWIRWDIERGRYVLNRRVGLLPSTVSYPYDERRVEHMVKCLVLSRRVTVSSVRKKRLWLF